MDILSIISEYWLQFLCSLLSALLLKTYATIKTSIKETEKKQTAIQNGVVSLLKERISRTHSQCVRLGYCPINVLESIELVYNQLRELDPSATYDDLISDMRHMKHYPQNESQKPAGGSPVNNDRFEVEY
jgi:hypothetical protein